MDRLTSVVRYTIQPEETGEPITALVTCPHFQQRLLRFDGEGEERRDGERDEVLYVLEGTGVATVGGETQPLEPGTGVFVARGTPWRVDSAEGLLILSVLVEEPLPATASHAVIAEGERGSATAGREFTLLAQPENGCASVTQFVGYIPPGRAPDHYHRYDEVVYVLAGEGAFHVDGESETLQPGSCVHLPARLIHCLENRGPGEMRVLGVFRPAGSPAEAYYPDDNPAVVPVG
jgi:mannose-6-phosphate isomerase-like protein (cupin superfamily)